MIPGAAEDVISRHDGDGDRPFVDKIFNEPDADGFLPGIPCARSRRGLDFFRISENFA
jgi:hypothetical protein